MKYLPHIRIHCTNRDVCYDYPFIMTDVKDSLQSKKIASEMFISYILGKIELDIMEIFPEQIKKYKLKDRESFRRCRRNNT